MLLDSGPWAHDIETWRHPQNRKYLTYRNAVRGGLRSHATAGNMHKHLVKFGRVVIRAKRQTDKQTNKQTDILITVLRPLPECEVILILKRTGSRDLFYVGRPHNSLERLKLKSSYIA